MNQEANKKSINLAGLQKHVHVLTVAVIAIAVIAAAALWFPLDGLDKKTEKPSRILILNSEDILRSKTYEIMQTSSGVAPEQAAIRGREFAKKLSEIVDAYRDKGYVVLNGAAILSASPDLDITAAVAQQLGVKIVSREQFRSSRQVPNPTAQAAPMAPATTPAPK